MSSSLEALAHLKKAKEFLTAAELLHDAELYSASISSAVSAGINAKDAICISLTGFSGKADNHTQAIKELKVSGPVGKDVAEVFARLLRLKPHAQYLSDAMTQAQSSKALSWAMKLVSAAQEVKH